MGGSLLTTVATSIYVPAPVTNRDHIRGHPSAPITLIAYGDFACPRCIESDSIVRKLHLALGDRLRTVFRHFPMLTLRADAHRAAEAAEASGGQNKYWEMHDLLFQHHSALSDRYLRLCATQVGLDMERFNRDMMLHTYAFRVYDDILSAGRSGVHLAPALFINDMPRPGPYRFESLLSDIEAST
jgi:protein-disulfide isomerase